MSKVKNHDYEQAASLIKTQGVLSIVFGGIGVFIGLVILVFLWIVLSTSYATEDVIAALFLSLLSFAFLLPSFSDRFPQKCNHLRGSLPPTRDREK